MADKRFFDLFNEKMASLKPSEKYRSDDWEALGERLNTALPIQPQKRRKAIVLPLLLLTALLSSNALWWHSNDQYQSDLARLSTQLTDIQTAVAVLSSASIKQHVEVIHDTIWRTNYWHHKIDMDYAAWQANQNTSALRMQQQYNPDRVSSDDSNTVVNANASAQSVSLITLSAISADSFNSNKSAQRVDYQLSYQLLPFQLKPPVLEILKTLRPPPAHLLIITPDSNKPFAPVIKKRPTKFRPPFFKVGASAGLLYPVSSGLMHEGGFSCRLQGEIGVTRHWSLTTALNMGRLHYKADVPAAILGNPTLPVVANGDHLVEMDVTGQQIRQLDVGLRYTFSQPGQIRPYLGLFWSVQSLLPFMIEYEIQQESNGTIRKDFFEVNTLPNQRDIIGLNVGLEIPISKRIDLSIQSSYQRQWKKPSAATPDLTGVNTSLNWRF